MSVSFTVTRPLRLPSPGGVVGGAGGRLRWRRRLDVVLLATAVVLAGAMALVGALIGTKERITALWAGAEVSAEGGSAQISEVVDWDYGTEQRHGIYRDVPGLQPDAEVSVSSATAPDQVEIEGAGADTRIRIGDPSQLISGRHRYRIGYPLDGVVQDGQLAWNAVGTGWPVHLGRIEIHLVAPFEITAARCVQGVTGSQRPCELSQPEPGHLVARIDRLNAHEGVTVYGVAGRRLDAAPGLQPPTSGTPTPGGGALLPPALLAVPIALIGAVMGMLLIRRAGRERVMAGGAVAAAWAEPGREIRVDPARLASLATIEFSPPEELTPAQGGVLLAEAVRPEHKLAWLIGAAADGYLHIDGDREHVALVRRPEPSDAERRDGWTASQVRAMFGDRSRLPLGEYDPGFADTWRAVGDRLEDWRRTSELWDPAGDRRCLVARGLGILAAVAGVALLIGGGVLVTLPGAAPGWWPPIVGLGAAVASVGAAALIGGRELRVRTPAGTGLWLRTESFRRFLAESEARHADEAAKRGLLLPYTAWAVAVGEVDRWSRAVAASSVPPTDRRAYYPRVAPTLYAATSSTSTQPSSSGSGGGFSSGGGGGGAGGGSGRPDPDPRRSSHRSWPRWRGVRPSGEVASSTVREGQLCSVRAMPSPLLTYGASKSGMVIEPSLASGKRGL